MLKNAFDLPPQHRPGWNGQRIQTINVDIEVEPGWSQVPLSLINELKVFFFILKLIYSVLQNLRNTT